MFILLLIDMMMRNAKAPKPPILLAIDEFPSLGKLEGIEVVAPVMRSYGVRFWAVGQDISQFAATYPSSWTGFIGNAEAVQFMGVTHPATVDFLVERLGEHVVKERVKENGKFRQVRSERRLLDPDQVSRLLAKDQKNQIVWRGSKKPLLLKTTPYFEYMPCWYYDKDPRYPEKLRRSFWRWGRSAAAPQKAPEKLVIPDEVKKFMNMPPEKSPGQLPDGAAKSKLLLPPRAWSDILDEANKPADKAADPSDKLPNGETLGDFDRRTAGMDVDAKIDEWNKAVSGIKPRGVPSGDADILRVKPNEDIISALVYKPMTDFKKPPAKRMEPWQEALERYNAMRAQEDDKALSAPMEELEKMIGLGAVKAEVKKTVNMVKLAKAREEAGMPKVPLTRHLVFTGNPGTGKTT